MGLGVGFGRWSGRMALGALLPVTKLKDDVGGRFWQGAGRIEGCWQAVNLAEKTLDTCLVFEAGVLSAEGVGVRPAREASRLWLGPGGRVVAGVPLGQSRMRALLGLDALVPLLPWKFTVESGSVQINQPSPVAVRMDLGVGCQFE